MDSLTPDLIALIARHLDLRDLLRLSAVSSTFRKGCYDPGALRGAIARGRGGKLTRGDLQSLLKIDRIAAAALAHQHYPQTHFRPRGYYLYGADAVVSAMHAFGENARVVSWKPPNPSTNATRNPRKRRAVAKPAAPCPITAFFARARSPTHPRHTDEHGGHHATAYAFWSSFPNAASFGSSWRSSPPSLSMRSPSGCATPVM